MKAKIVSRSLGAQVLSAKINNCEIFYLSPLSSKDDPARGGVPILFPQFAENGPLSKHGFARNLPWVCIKDQRLPEFQEQKYKLTIAPNNAKKWPHNAQLELTSKVNSNGFHQELRIVNTGSSAFSWTGGLHPYFFVENLLSTSIEGLKNIDYQDHYNLSDYRWTTDTVTFNHSPCEKLFATAPHLKLVSNNRSLTLSTTGFTQWMIWNPGHKFSNLVDLPSDDWQSFLCIEPVVVSDPIWLNPDEEFIGTFKVFLK